MGPKGHTPFLTSVEMKLNFSLGFIFIILSAVLPSPLTLHLLNPEAHAL